MDQDEISVWVERLRGESGVKIEKMRKRWHTDNPSVQGTWTPFLNKPPSQLHIGQDLPQFRETKS